RQIVCGAHNYKVGDRVPVALIGAVLPGNFEIKQSKLRGIDSFGMMCSAKELGLGEDHSGLLILEQRPALGTPINDVFPGSDTVFDIEVTPNRPDCLSYVGMAREMAAYFGLTLSYPEVKLQMILEKAPSLIESLTVENPASCPHYRGYSIRGVKIGPSPEWLATALKAAGLRSINNVVDVTNFVLMELGQPLHAFDANKIAGKKIVVRNAKEGEKITTLDGRERTLDSTMLAICDAEKPLVIAGVMGSLDAEVDGATKDIFLESAYFTPVIIRRTSRKLALSSDSSYRYERGIDPKGPEFAAMRAIELILEVAGGELAGSPRIAGEASAVGREIAFTGDYMRKMLGFDVSDRDIESVLMRLELGVDVKPTGPMSSQFVVTVPSFRLDLERPIDLVEEFLRIYGTDKIPSVPVNSNALVGGDDPMAAFWQKAGNALASLGYSECVNYPLRSGPETALWSGKSADLFALANPLASDQSHLRPSILPGLLDNLLLNQSRGNGKIRLFEIGRSFRESAGKLWEHLSLGIVMTTENPAQWRAETGADFFDTSALAIEMMAIAGAKIDAARLSPLKAPGVWQEGHAATFASNVFDIRCGLLDLAMTSKLGIKGAVYAVECAFQPVYLEKSAPTGIAYKYKALSMQPPATRDIAVVAPAAAASALVEGAIRKAAQKAVDGSDFAVESVRLFDIYEGKGLAEGTKSLAYTLTFRSATRTLTDAEVNAAFEKVQKLSAEAGYPPRA
ncbi:MAG TPA: phenylalanine--tRNA ligase subunit beta, partial [Opitutales bacterium]|nr:phenylalanine--tRNA ligase subunit beta [Opitutales bacterium]